MDKNNNKHISNAHDQFFRTAMADKRVAFDFLQSWLPADLYQLINLKKLELQPRSFINDLRQETTVDVLFKTEVKGHEAYLYLLLEHQSKPDKLMPFRMLKYLCNIIDQHLKTHKTQKIPMIYPIVIYHGKSKYPYSTDLKDLVSAPAALVDEYFLKPFQLIDLGQIDDEILKQHTWSGAMEFALKHIYDRDFFTVVQNITYILQQMFNKGGKKITTLVLQYGLERGNLADIEAFFKLINTQISHEVGEEIMTLAQQLRKEGREEGRMEGELKGQLKKEREIVKRMIEAGSDPDFIAKVTGLSLDKIDLIQNH